MIIRMLTLGKRNRVAFPYSNKGGTGKTTTAVNLGAALAEKEKIILEVDLDPQGNLSVNLGVNIDNLDQTIYDVLLNPKEIPIDQVIITDLSNDCDLVPANIDHLHASAHAFWGYRRADERD